MRISYLSHSGVLSVRPVIASEAKQSRRKVRLPRRSPYVWRPPRNEQPWKTPRLLSYFAVICSLITAHCSLSFAGSLNPSGPPSATFYTLSDLYARASSGTVAASHSLGPAATAGPTMVTMTQLYNILPGGTTTSASASNVSSGKTFITRVNGAMTFSTGTYVPVVHDLPDTGQTSSYTATFGEDHDYQPAASQMSYTMYTDASMTTQAPVESALVTVDNRTGLMWTTDGTLTSPGAQPMTWAAAFTWISALNAANYAGKNDWRLPNYRELISIAKYQSFNPAIDTGNFRDTQNSYYWTSTTYVPLTPNAWSVDFYDGRIYRSGDVADTFYVRPVRGGP